MISILYCGNDKVFDGILTSALSILKRSNLRESIRFFIFTMDVSHIKPEFLPVTDDQASFLDKVVKQYNSENEVVKIDVTEHYMREFSGCPN